MQKAVSFAPKPMSEQEAKAAVAAENPFLVRSDGEAKKGVLYIAAFSGNAEKAEALSLLWLLPLNENRNDANMAEADGLRFVFESQTFVDKSVRFFNLNFTLINLKNDDTKNFAARIDVLNKRFASPIYKYPIASVSDKESHLITIVLLRL